MTLRSPNTLPGLATSTQAQNCSQSTHPFSPCPHAWVGEHRGESEHRDPVVHHEPGSDQRTQCSHLQPKQRGWGTAAGGQVQTVLAPRSSRTWRVVADGYQDSCRGRADLRSLRAQKLARSGAWNAHSRATSPHAAGCSSPSPLQCTSLPPPHCTSVLLAAHPSLLHTHPPTVNAHPSLHCTSIPLCLTRMPPPHCASIPPPRCTSVPLLWSASIPPGCTSLCSTWLHTPGLTHTTVGASGPGSPRSSLRFTL